MQVVAVGFELIPYEAEALMGDELGLKIKL